MTIAELRAKAAQARQRMSAIQSAAKSEARGYTAEEDAELDALMAEAEECDRQIGELEQSAKAHAEKSAKVDAMIAAGKRSHGPRSAADTGRVQVTVDELDFRSAGEFFRHVFDAGRRGGFESKKLARVREFDPEVGAAASTYGSEGVGVDGGYLVPTEYSSRIREVMAEGPNFVAMTDLNPVQGNAMVFPSDETTEWGTDGVRAYWTNEAAAATQTKPKLKQKTLRLKKLMALTPVTDELLADTVTLENFLTRRMARSIRFKSNDALINGTGDDQPLGIFPNAAVPGTGLGPLVSVAKDSSQTAATITIGNITNMFGRMLPEWQADAVWIMNHDCFNQIPRLTLGNYPIWTPPAGAKETPSGLLLGRPIYLSQSCKTLGTQGDIFLVSWRAYCCINKASGVEVASSIHLYFDAGETAFRSTFRLDGQPWLSTALSPKNGSNTLSPFVTLDTRS